MTTQQAILKTIELALVELAKEGVDPETKKCLYEFAESILGSKEKKKAALCGCKTKDGKPCKKVAVNGKNTCNIHDKSGTEEAKCAKIITRGPRKGQMCSAKVKECGMCRTHMPKIVEEIVEIEVLPKIVETCKNTIYDAACMISI